MLARYPVKPDIVYIPTIYLDTLDIPSNNNWATTTRGTSMLAMPKEPKKPKTPKSEQGGKRKRNAIFITLDDPTEGRLQAFLDLQRVKPDRAAVALTALLEFLDRVEQERAK